MVVFEAPPTWWLPTPHLDQAGRLLFGYGLAEGIGEMGQRQRLDERRCAAPRAEPMT